MALLPLDALRVAPATVRSFAAGPQGMELLAVGPSGSGDAEALPVNGRYAGRVNSLAAETSPYLLQHKDNPVHWQPWGREAFAAARERDVPVLLSIGYSACHWCHVMAHESFEDADTAALMNELFVSIKVDREERPDVDALYMDAVVSLTGAGGWPMTVFLTHDGEPFYGGTYYPPLPRPGMASFRQVLEAVSEAWHERRGEVTQMAGRLTDALRESARRAPSRDPVTEAIAARAVEHLGQIHDPTWGGFGPAPKFPQAPLIGFLLRTHARTGDAEALQLRHRDARRDGAGGNV